MPPPWIPEGVGISEKQVGAKHPCWNLSLTAI